MENAASSFAKDVRPLFTDTDVDHMKNYGMDLSSLDDVKQHAVDILKVVTNGSMPPPGTGERWTQEMCATFQRWVEQGCPP